MSVRIYKTNTGPAVALFKCFGRQLPPGAKIKLPPKNTTIITIPISMLSGEDLCLASMGKLTALHRATTSLVHLLCKAHQMGDIRTDDDDDNPPDRRRRNPNTSNKKLYMEMIPADEVGVNQLYFSELGDEKERNNRRAQQVRTPDPSSWPIAPPAAHAVDDNVSSPGSDRTDEFLFNRITPPHTAAIRIYFTGEYQMADNIERVMDENRDSLNSIRQPDRHGGKGPRKDPTPTDIAVSINEHPDQSRRLHCRDNLLRALGILTGRSYMAMAVVAGALTLPMNDVENPACIIRSLGLPTAVNPSHLHLHRDFRMPTNYISGGDIDRPDHITFPHPEMVFEFSAHNHQTWDQVIYMKLPRPVAEITDKSTGLLQFEDAHGINTDGTLVMAELDYDESEMVSLHSSELQVGSARDAYFAAAGNEHALRACSTIAEQAEKNEEERNTIYAKRLKAAADPTQTATDKQHAAFLDQARFEARAFSQCLPLLNPDNPALSLPTAATMRWLGDYLNQNDQTLFRYQPKVFRQLTYMSSWLATRAIALEYVYRTATSHMMVLRMLVSVLNASDPNPNKVHHLATGNGATSKSFGLRTVEAWCTPGQADDVGHKTAMANTTPINKNGGVELWHEGNPKWFGVGENGASSANQAESMFKRVLTEGTMTVESCHSADDGSRVMIQYTRECNVAVLVNLNLGIHRISEAMRTRFLVSYASNVPRPGHTIAHCICETPSTGQRVAKEEDCANMQWIMAMVSLVNLFIRCKALPTVRTSLTDYLLPEILARAGDAGLNNTNAPRDVQRLRAVVRAFVIVRAVLLVFASGQSPLVRWDEATGRFVSLKFAIHHFALVGPHLDDAMDETILSAAMGLVKHQWENPVRYHVLEAIMRVHFTCDEEEYDHSTTGESVQSPRDQLIMKKTHNDACTVIGSESVVGQIGTVGADWYAFSAAILPKLVASPAAVGTTSVLRMMVAGGMFAVTPAIALARKLSAGDPAHLPSSADTDAGTLRGGRGGCGGGGGGGGPSTPMNILPGINVMAVSDRGDLPGHRTTHCSCCVCSKCTAFRQNGPSAGDPVAPTQPRIRTPVVVSGKVSDDQATGDASTVPSEAPVHLSREARLKARYDAIARDCTIDEAVAATNLANVLKLEDVLPDLAIMVDPEDDNDIQAAMTHRVAKAQTEVRARVQRARHLEQMRYQVLEGRYRSSYVLVSGLFTASMTPAQCRTNLAGVLSRMIPGFNKGSISTAINELCQTTVPFKTSRGHRQNGPALLLNEMRDGIMIAKHILVNNRDSILMHITRSLMEHHYTLPHMHLFGPNSDPRAAPFIFDTFAPMPRAVDPCIQKGRDIPAETMSALQQTLSRDSHKRDLIEGAYTLATNNFTTSPSVHFANGHVNDFAHTAGNVVEYGFLPSIEVMDREEELICTTQKSWDNQFKLSVENELEDTSSCLKAYNVAKTALGPRPRDMISYPPSTDPTDRMDSVDARTPLEWVRTWGWSDDRINHMETEIIAMTGPRGSAVVAEKHAPQIAQIEYPFYRRTRFRKRHASQRPVDAGLTGLAGAADRVPMDTSPPTSSG